MTNLINLRAELVESATIAEYKRYGKDSATCNSRNFAPNIGLFVSYALKPILQQKYK